MPSAYNFKLSGDAQNEFPERLGLFTSEIPGKI